VIGDLFAVCTDYGHGDRDGVAQTGLAPLAVRPVKCLDHLELCGQACATGYEDVVAPVEGPLRAPPPMIGRHGLQLAEGDGELLDRCCSRLIEGVRRSMGPLDLD